MPQIHFTTTSDDGDDYSLARRKWPSVPRVGEHVIFDGLIARKHTDELVIAEDSRNEKFPRERVMFIVDLVLYEDDLDIPDAADPLGVTVHLVLPPQDRAWRGANRADD